jgi:hypothetical protein
MCFFSRSRRASTSSNMLRNIAVRYERLQRSCMFYALLRNSIHG